MLFGRQKKKKSCCLVFASKLEYDFESLTLLFVDRIPEKYLTEIVLNIGKLSDSVPSLSVFRLSRTNPR